MRDQLDTRRAKLRRALLLILAGIALATGATAGAETINVPCNAATLSSVLSTAGSNGEEDLVWLAPSCVYNLAATTSIGADLGNPLRIYGRGATLSGQNQRAVLVVNAGAVVHFDRVTVTDGKSNSNAGGIRNLGTTTLTDSTVSRSTAQGDGGAIQNIGSMRLTRSSVTGNTATVLGGGIDNTGKLTLMESAVSGNTGQFGGGIRNQGTTTLINSTVSANGAFQGGGLLNDSPGTTILSNVTVSNNDGGGNNGGGGIRNAGHLAIDNSVIANSNDGGADCSNLGTITASGGNLVEDGSCAISGALTGDPLLDGPTGKPVHYLPQPGSPVVDTGSKPSCPGFDLRGKRRPMDGDDDGVNACDLGAIERPSQGDCGLTGIEPFLLLPFVRMLRKRKLKGT